MFEVADENLVWAGPFSQLPSGIGLKGAVRDSSRESIQV